MKSVLLSIVSIFVLVNCGGTSTPKSQSDQISSVIQENQNEQVPTVRNSLDISIVPKNPGNVPDYSIDKIEIKRTISMAIIGSRKTTTTTIYYNDGTSEVTSEESYIKRDVNSSMVLIKGIKNFYEVSEAVAINAEFKTNLNDPFFVHYEWKVTREEGQDTASPYTDKIGESDEDILNIETSVTGPIGIHLSVYADYKDTFLYAYDKNVSIGHDIEYDRKSWHMSRRARSKYDERYVGGGHSANAGLNLNNLRNKTLGEGVTIAIIDTCFNETAFDHIENVIARYNSVNKSSDVSCAKGDLGEGTHGVIVSSVIGAPINGKGIEGIAPNAKIILISIGNAGGITNNSITTTQYIQMFDFAYQNGAEIISNSWSTGMFFNGQENIFKDLKAQGVSVFFASGNYNEDLDNKEKVSESTLDSVVGIGASNEFFKGAGYSSYSDKLDFSFPVGDGIPAINNIGEVQWFAGTSAAAPQAAAVAALIKSLDKSLTPDKIYLIMKKSCTKNLSLTEVNEKFNSNGHSKKLGWGKIDGDKILNIMNL